MLSSDTHPLTATIVKENTSRLHMELEELLIPQLLAIQSDGDYARILQIFYEMVYPLENLIERYLTTEMLPDIQHRRKSNLILQDLARLGFDDTTLRNNDNQPVIQSREQAMGALYVLEGSTLGGKIIANMLIKKNDNFKTSLNYFTAYGTETGTKWRLFLDHLNQYQNLTQIETITKTANETFLKFKLWIQHNLQPIK
jgi:heme oxygenase